MSLGRSLLFPLRVSIMLYSLPQVFLTSRTSNFSLLAPLQLPLTSQAALDPFVLKRWFDQASCHALRGRVLSIQKPNEVVLRIWQPCSKQIGLDHLQFRSWLCHFRHHNCLTDSGIAAISVGHFSEAPLGASLRRRFGCNFDWISQFSTFTQMICCHSTPICLVRATKGRSTVH